MIKNNTYIYVLELTFNNIPGVTDPVKAHVSNLTVIANYHDDMHPSFVSRFFVPQAIVGKILANRKKITCILKITKNVYETTQFTEQEIEAGHDRTPAGIKTLIQSNIELQSEYVPFFDDRKLPAKISYDKLDDTTNEIEPVGEDGNKSSSQIAKGQDVALEAYLFDIKAIKLFKSLFINAMATCDVSTALMYILSKSTATKIICDKPDNDQSYSEIKMPLYNLRNSVASLQTRYGIYNVDVILYYFFGTLYMLRRYGDDHDIASTDYTDVMLNVRMNPDLMGNPKIANIQLDPNDPRKITYNLFTDLKEVDISADLGEILGTQLIMGNLNLALNALSYDPSNQQWAYTEPAITLSRTSTSHESTGVSGFFDYDEMNNPYAVASKMRADTSSFMTAIAIDSVDFKSFGPNMMPVIKVFDNTVQDIKFRGKYRIHSLTMSFVRVMHAEQQDVNEMVCKAHVVLERDFPN